jgi:hypothetical protein
MSDNENYQEFPRMIYHAAQGEKVVNNESELNGFLVKGWQKEPINAEDQEAVIKEKINWHTKELEILKVSLRRLYEVRIRENERIIEAEKAVEKEEKKEEVKEVPVIEATPVLDTDKEPDTVKEVPTEEVKEEETTVRPKRVRTRN